MALRPSGTSAELALRSRSITSAHMNVDPSCNHKSMHSGLNLDHILDSQEMVARIIEQIESCRRGKCATNEGNIKQRWRNVLLTGTYLCAWQGHPVDFQGLRYRVDPEKGSLLFQIGDNTIAFATAVTIRDPQIDFRTVIFSERPSECWAREIAHEALHEVLQESGHEHIQGPQGLEGCITCGGQL